MNNQHYQDVEKRLRLVLRELEHQPSVGSSYSADELPFDEEMQQLSEYIETAAEYEVAYETIVMTISKHPYVLSGTGAIALLETGLILGYKTSQKEDSIFDRR